MCTIGGAINCELVLSSAYAVVAGTTLPTAAAGLGWFAVSAALAGILWRGTASRTVARLQLAWSAIGLVTVVGLVFVEIVVLGAICIWCTAAHISVVVIFLATLGKGINR